MKHTLRLLLLLPLLLLAQDIFALDAPPRKRPRRTKKSRTTVVQAARTADTARQKPVVAVPEKEPITKRTPDYPEPDPEMTPEQFDSLLYRWQEQRRVEAYEAFVRDFIEVDSLQALAADTVTIDSTPDSVFVRRLRDLASPIEFAYNPVVKTNILRYITKLRNLTGRLIGLSQYYFPLFEEELIKAGLPIELRALPIIESALNPTAVSRAGAAGLWQFMPITGKACGLEINSLVDERLDPVRSTQAACKYLRGLYDIYHNWPLALAAYNCGPGNVNKAMARSGGKNFWEIYDYLPRETRGYVPAFIAASYVYAYHRNHGIEAVDAPLPMATDTLHVARLLHFGQIASTIDVPVETLRILNPQYRIDIIPATTKPYTLTLPQHAVTNYIASETTIYQKDSLYLKEYINPANLDKKRSQGPAAKFHVVRSGDTLGAIARRYHVSLRSLMRLNRLQNANKLRLGQRLRIR